MVFARGVIRSSASLRRNMKATMNVGGHGANRPNAPLARRNSRQQQQQQQGSIAANAAAAQSPTVQGGSVVDGLSNLHGFEVVKEEFIAEYGSQAVLFRHVKTGAELMSVSNDDENKVFGVVLRTPPKDSTGLPHILEHSVLCGSRKYPIKEPFVELIKGSLNTFLNAFTYPDRTCYPVASANLQDFYNLVDVYLDAVFFPRLTPAVFQQEGWHYEAEDAKEPFTFKGVVFNEMKGVYSQPDSVMGRDTQQAIFPDNTYGVDSGGDPEAIPNLTFDDFIEFHSTLYHPSNSRIWFYGDDDVEERLRKLDEYLSLFEKKDIDSRIKPQSLIAEPRRVTKTYAVGEDAAADPKHMLSVNWLLAEDKMDPERELTWGFLDQLLLGTSAAPLQKALTESNLGESTIGGGLSDELRQPTFGIGLKGIKPENVEKVEELVMSELKRLSEEGFTADAIEAAVNTIEFSLRENNTGSFPRGLSMMLRSMASWLYEREPFEGLKYKAPLEAMKAKLAAGEPIFQDLLKEMLANQHRVTVELKPDIDVSKNIEEKEKTRLEQAKASMSSDEVDEAVTTTKELKVKQETPDTSEALSCVPTLKISDIPKKTSTVPTDISEEDGVTVLRHDLFTNEILYSEVLLDMRAVPDRLLPLLPLFCRSLKQMGTEDEDFVTLTQRIGSKTGGVSIYPMISNKRDSDEPVAYLVLRGKSTLENSGEMYNIMSDLLLKSRLDDKERFRQMVLETKASGEAALQGAGHSLASSRLSAMDSAAALANERTGGLEYIEYIRDLEKRIDSEWDSIEADLKEIRHCLLTRQGAIVNLTADTSTLENTQGVLKDFLSKLPSEAREIQSWGKGLTARNEAITLPTQVNYVGKGCNLYKSGYELHGSAYVINKLLGTTWLWDRVRVSGGAYGGFSRFDSHSGMFSYLSYRDPNLLGTLDNYDGTAEFLRSLDVDDDALNKAIIGAIGDVDAYKLPDAKGYAELQRYLLGVTLEERQKRRDEMLSTSASDFKKFADAIAAVETKGNVVAICSPEAATKAQEERPGTFDDIKNML